jgi:hypothetical protein
MRFFKKMSSIHVSQDYTIVKSILNQALAESIIGFSGLFELNIIGIVLDNV